MTAPLPTKIDDPLILYGESFASRLLLGKIGAVSYNATAAMNDISSMPILRDVVLSTHIAEDDDFEV
jgi:hypothetical protein